MFASANLLLFAAIRACLRAEIGARSALRRMRGSVFFLSLSVWAITAGSRLRAPRSHARPEASRRNQQGRAAIATGSYSINSV